MEKLRTAEDILARCKTHEATQLGRCRHAVNVGGYAVALNLTETSFDTPGSCMVTP